MQGIVIMRMVATRARPGGIDVRRVRKLDTGKPPASAKAADVALLAEPVPLHVGPATNIERHTIPIC